MPQGPSTSCQFDHALIATVSASSWSRRKSMLRYTVIYMLDGHDTHASLSRSSPASSVPARRLRKNDEPARFCLR